MSRGGRYQHSYHIWDDAAMEWKEVDHAEYIKYKKAHRDAPVKNIPDYPFYFHFYRMI